MEHIREDETERPMVNATITRTDGTDTDSNDHPIIDHAASHTDETDTDDDDHSIVNHPDTPTDDTDTDAVLPATAAADDFKEESDEERLPLTSRSVGP